ncbi:MAG: HAD-IIB family hydrolase, partial [Candidatus Bathyarchaeota archaeon]
MNYLLVCDLDDTLTGDKNAIEKFNKIIKSKKFYLVYSSGRFKSSMISLISMSGLVNPDAIIANLGTEIYFSPDWKIDKEWKQIVTKNWKKEKIVSTLEFFNLKPQPYEKKFVLPFFTDNEALVKQIQKKIKSNNAKVVHTKNQFLDIIPNVAGKGNAARYLGNKLEMPIICCGDSENDRDMLKKSDYGILVGNAPTHLKKEMKDQTNIYI